jgi:RNA polymerase sigma-70 factor (ECF subfamily)
VARTRAGDAQAFEALWAQSEPRVAAVVRAYVSHPEDQEDLTRDVLLRAFQSLDTLRDSDQFKSWLDTSARRRCVDFLRRKGRVSFQSLDEPADPDSGGNAQEPKADEPDVDDLVIARTMARTARASLAKMTERCRVCYNLRTHTPTSLREIARRIGATEGAVKSMVYRARRGLEDDLQPYIAA